MFKQNWRTFWGSALLTGGLLTLFTVNVYAQSAPPSAVAVVVNPAAAEPGVLVVAVEADSPAAQAGLKRGDIVLKANGTPTNSVQALKDVVRSKQAGDKLALQVQHGDDQRQLEVTIGERAGQPYLGILPAFTQAQPTNAIEAQAMPLPGIPAAPGMNMTMSNTVSARVISVLPNSPAAAAEIQPGDVIVAIDGQPLTPEADLNDLIKRYKVGDKITLKVQRAGAAMQTVERTVTLGQKPESANQPYLGVRIAPMITYQVEQIQGTPGASRPFVDAQRFWFANPNQPYAMPPILIMPFGGWFGLPALGNFGAPWQHDFIFTLPAPPAMIQGNVQILAGPNGDAANHMFEAPMPPAPPVFFYNARPGLEAPSAPAGDEELMGVVL